MDKPIPNIAFQSMRLSYKARDFLKPRQIVLSEVPLKPGDTVLDYGCGTGSYTFIMAKIVGPTGRVVALDIHPLAIKHVENLVKSRGLANIKTVLSDCDTGISDNSVDVIMLFEIFHLFYDPNKILRELFRVLKPDGILSFMDHHMNEPNIINGMTSNGLFILKGKAEQTFSFVKNQNR